MFSIMVQLHTLINYYSVPMGTGRSQYAYCQYGSRAARRAYLLKIVLQILALSTVSGHTSYLLHLQNMATVMFFV